MIPTGPAGETSARHAPVPSLPSRPPRTRRARQLRALARRAIHGPPRQQQRLMHTRRGAQRRIHPPGRVEVTLTPTLPPTLTQPLTQTLASSLAQARRARAAAPLLAMRQLPPVWRDGRGDRLHRALCGCTPNLHPHPHPHPHPHQAIGSIVLGVLHAAHLPPKPIGEPERAVWQPGWERYTGVLRCYGGEPCPAGAAAAQAFPNAVAVRPPSPPLAAASRS